MYSLLAVDDDRTCLFILKTYLEKWSYQVTTVKNAHEALATLGNKSFDLVLTDVHMPDMNGFQLQERINEEFSLPVILISADTRAEVMCMGLKNGAQRFFVKPVAADDLKDIWQFADWWKRTKNYNAHPLRQINGSSQESATMGGSHKGIRNNNALDVSFSATKNTHPDNRTGRRTKRLVWTSDLHNRFVEAILVIGFHKAVPTNILEVMNVEGLTRGQVASHLQKYQKFIEGVLVGNRNIELSHWIDLNYYSRFVSGNPNLVLLNLLKDEHRKGKLAAHNPLRPPKKENINGNARAPNGSSSSLRRLPPFIIEEGSSSRSIYGTLMPNNESYSSVNIASRGLGSATLPYTHNESMGSIVGSNTSNFTHNPSYQTSQMDYFNQNTLAQEQNNYSGNGGLHGGAKSYTQLGNNHGEPGIGISSDANHFGETSAMNTQQLDDQQMTAGSWFNNTWREDGKEY